MGSLDTTQSSSVNVLEYLRSKTSVDLDALDLKAADDFGPFKDCTSNQWETSMQLCNPQNAALLKESVALARHLQKQHTSVSVEELAVEIAMIQLCLRMIPKISGAVHVMCNPLYSWDTEKIIETGYRFHRICHVLEPEFDLSRIIMKVPSTWEGLQACSKLRDDGIKTLATTAFTMEQIVLAGEAGCISISPFAHELRAHLGTSYVDTEPVLDLFLEAQQYYKQHGIPTKVKSCAFTTTDEMIRTAGVDAMTLPGEQVAELAAMTDPLESLESRSVFLNAAKNTQAPTERLTYINDKAKFMRAYTTNGRGKAKTEDSLAVFCGFQIQAEALVSASEALPVLEPDIPKMKVDGAVLEQTPAIASA